MGIGVLLGSEERECGANPLQQPLLYEGQAFKNVTGIANSGCFRQKTAGLQCWEGESEEELKPENLLLFRKNFHIFI